MHARSVACAGERRKSYVSTSTPSTFTSTTNTFISTSTNSPFPPTYSAPVAAVLAAALADKLIAPGAVDADYAAAKSWAASRGAALCPQAAGPAATGCETAPAWRGMSPLC